MIKHTIVLAFGLSLTALIAQDAAAPAAPAPAAPAAPAPAAPAPEAAAPAPSADAKPADAKPEDTKPADAVKKIMIGVTPAVMKFDTNAFEVQAGQKVMLLFKNEKCPLPHNIVICKPGTKDKVAAESLKFAADPNAMAAAFIPSTADIIFKGSKLVMTGQTDLLEFTAPTDAGDYPFLCTYPGHTMTMHGIMTVKK